jgi:hypothetical protein
MLERILKIPFAPSLLTLLLGSYWVIVGSKLTLEPPSAYAVVSLGPIAFPWLRSLIGALLFLIIAWRSDAIVKEFRLYEGETFPLFLYLFTLPCLFPALLFYHGVLLAGIAAIFLLNFLLRIYHQPSVAGLLFGAASLSCVAFFFWYPALLLFPLIPISVLVFRPFSTREFLLTIIGFLLPLCYWFGFGYLFEFDTGFKHLEWKQNEAFTSFSLELKDLGAVLFFVLSLAVAFLAAVQRKKYVVRQRNQLMVIYIYFLLATGSLFFHLYSLGLSVAPFGIFFLLSYGQLRKRWIMDVSFLLLIIFSFWKNFA